MDRKKQEEDFSSQRDNLTIVSISAKGAAGNIFQIELSDSSIFFVSSELIFKYELCSGFELSEDFCLTLEAEDEFVRCFDKALGLLNRRDHSSSELRLKLYKKGFKGSLDRVISELQSLSYLDDYRFCELYIQDRFEAGKSRNYIINKLFEKGLSRDLIFETMEDLYCEQKEMVNLEAQYNKIIRGKDLPSDKIISRLRSRGFDYFLIKNFIENLSNN